MNNDELKLAESGKLKVESYLELDKINQKFRHSELDSESKKQTLKQRISVRHLCRLATRMSRLSVAHQARLSERERNPRQVQGDKTTFNSYKKVAFTLAEVLITLGIIGVVAAMTMPVLISKHNENVTMTKLKKFYSVMSQAQLQAIAEYGDVENWDWVSDADSNNAAILQWFNKYFAPYLKKVEVSDIANNGGIAVKFADGSIMNIRGFSGYYLMVFYYTNYKTFVNNTARNGKDKFWFGMFHKNSLANETIDSECTRFHPYLCAIDIHRFLFSPNDINFIKNNTQYGCYNGDGRFCARLLMKNGWKVPEDYPFKF